MAKFGGDKENARHFIPYLSAFGELRRLGALPKRGIIPRALRDEYLADLVESGEIATMEAKNGGEYYKIKYE